MLMIYGVILIASFPYVVQTFKVDDGFPIYMQKNGNFDGSDYIRISCCVYSLGILVWLVMAIGFWPFAAYTVISWSLMTIRFFSLQMGFYAFASMIRLPAFAMNSITVSVWWLVLFPAFITFMNEDARRGFIKFNKHPLLFNLHFINLPMVLLDTYMHPRTLTGFDLWITVMIAFVYLLFYLCVLDARGAHLYIILSPRTTFFIVSTSFLLGLKCLCFIACQAISTWRLRQILQAV